MRMGVPRKVGTVIEFVIYINMLTFPVSAIGWTASMIQRAAASQKRLNEFLNVYKLKASETFKKEVNGMVKIYIGKFKTYEEAYPHIVAGAKKVILSAPPEDDRIKTVVLGVNESILDGSEVIISNASCTTNNAAPMIKIIDELCGIEQAYITTVHSYTTDQSLHDQPHKDLRRARGAAQSIVPTTTGAAKALTKIFPKLDGKLGGSGIRVPVPDGSLTDITCYVSRAVSIEEINAAFLKASQTNLKGILAYTEDPIVSVDIIGNSNSCLFDAQLTSVIDKMVKVVGWYDNEIGYSSRIIDLIGYISNK